MILTNLARKVSCCGIVTLVGISLTGLLRSNILPGDFLAHLQSDSIFSPSGTVLNNITSNIDNGNASRISSNDRPSDAIVSAKNPNLTSDFSSTSALLAANEYSESYLSACLLIKDDNDILNEWIAYHYHLWRLRRIVVAVDPTSQTSPRELLQKWKTVFQDTDDSHYTQTNFDFEIWEEDSQYLPNWFLEDPSKVPERMGKLQEKHPDHEFSKEEILQISIHRFRQREFVRQCLLYFEDHRKNKHLSNASQFHPPSSWVMHIDTDEYMVLNPWLRRQQNHASNTTDANWSNRRLSEGALFKILLEQTSGSRHQNEKMGFYPCLSMPRLLFGGVEQNNSTVCKVTKNQSMHTHINFTDFWNKKSFETLRWKHHAPMITSGPLNGQPKVLLDLQGLAQHPKKQQFLQGTIHSIHRPIPSLCPKKVPFDGGANSKSSSSSSSEPPTFAIQHYLGSQERFLARKDPRRSIEVRGTIFRKSGAKQPLETTRVYFTVHWTCGMRHKLRTDDHAWITSFTL